MTAPVSSLPARRPTEAVPIRAYIAASRMLRQKQIGSVFSLINFKHCIIKLKNIWGTK